MLYESLILLHLLSPDEDQRLWHGWAYIEHKSSFLETLVQEDTKKNSDMTRWWKMLSSSNVFRHCAQHPLKALPLLRQGVFVGLVRVVRRQYRVGLVTLGRYGMVMIRGQLYFVNEAWGNVVK